MLDPAKADQDLIAENAALKQRIRGLEGADAADLPGVFRTS